MKPKTMLILGSLAVLLGSLMTWKGKASPQYLIGQSSIHATVPIYAPFLVVSYGQAAGATYPALAWNPQNQEYLLVWCHQLAGSVAIYAQTISKTGVLSSIYPVSETSTDVERCKPDVAYNTTSHNYLVVWENKATGLQFSAHGRLFTPGGALGQEITFGVSDSSNYVYPAVAYSSTSNEFLVVWATQPSGGNYSILAQRVSNTGEKLGGYTIAQGHDSVNNYDPDVAYNPSRNEYLVVWTSQSPSQSGLNRDIFGQRLTNDLVPLDGLLEIEYTSLDEYAPAVAAIQTSAPESGRYLVALERLWPDSGDHDVYGKIVKGDGTLVSIAAISASSLDERAPAVTGNMNNNMFLVSWNSTYLPPYQSNIGVRARNVSLEGNVLSPGWAGGIKSGMSAAASGRGDQSLVIFEDTTFFANADLFGRFWGDVLYLPLIIR
jgi:hypothetical protein